MNHLTTPAQCALEWWRSGGERTKERLLTLVAHFAETNAEIRQRCHSRAIGIGARQAVGDAIMTDIWLPLIAFVIAPGAAMALVTAVWRGCDDPAHRKPCGRNGDARRARRAGLSFGRDSTDCDANVIAALTAHGRLERQSSRCGDG